MLWFIGVENGPKWWENVEKELLNPVKKQWKVWLQLRRDGCCRVTGWYNYHLKAWRYSKKHKRNILFSLMVKQGRILKQFKDFKQLFEAVVFIESTVYLKINLYKFISKHPVLRRSGLSSSYSKKIKINQFCL